MNFYFVLVLMLWDVVLLIASIAQFVRWLIEFQETGKIFTKSLYSMLALGVVGLVLARFVLWTDVKW